MKRSGGKKTRESSLPKIQLRVAEAKHRDVGKHRARIDSDCMHRLDIEPGEVIELIGKRNTTVTAWPTDDEEHNKNIIRIDGRTRNNAGVSLNDSLTIKKAYSKAAKMIVLTPLANNNNITVDREYCEFVKNRLKGFPVVEGDEISVVILGNSMEFRVEKVTPRTIVKFERSTKLNIIAETSIDRKPLVTYE